MSDNPGVPPQSNSNSASEDALTPASLAPAYVFEATDPAETDAVREAMAQSAAVGEEVQAYRRLFNAMLHAAPAVQPPPEVSEKLLRAIQPPVAPIAQRYPGAPSTPDPLESMQVVPLITPPGGTKAVAGDRVNPLTGKPASAPAAAPVRAAVPPAPRSQAPQPKTQPAPRPTPYAPPYVQKGTAQPKAPPQYVAPRPPAGKRVEPTPAGFALTPLAPAAAGRGRAGMWAAWGLAIAALALLFVSNGYWGAQSVQLQQQNALLQTDAQSARQAATSVQNDLAAAQQQLEAKDTEIAGLQTSLANAQDQLVAAQDELEIARTQIADAAAMLAQVRAQTGGMTISDDMVDVLVRGPMQQASLAALNPSQPVSATARILWNPEMERGMLVAMEMPPLPADQAYQVWVLRAGVPTSAGVFTVDDRGMGMLEMDGMDLTDFEVAAITAEPAAGSVAPTGSIVIAGEL